ncbi:hypothetical protein X975_10162, partial [Stegodyphus mimosarum]
RASLPTRRSQQPKFYLLRKQFAMNLAVISRSCCQSTMR